MLLIVSIGNLKKKPTGTHQTHQFEKHFFQPNLIRKKDNLSI